MGLIFKDAKDHLQNARSDARITVSTLQQTNSQFHKVEHALKVLEEIADKEPARMPKEKARQMAITMSHMRRNAELLLKGIERIEDNLKHVK